jgi:hypothetical protein
MENGTINLWMYTDSDSILTSDNPVELLAHHKRYDTGSMDRINYRLEYDTVNGARLRLRLNYPVTGYADRYSSDIPITSDGLLGWHMYTVTWELAATSDNIKFYLDGTAVYTAGSDSIPVMAAASTDTFVTGSITGPYRATNTGSLQMAHLAIWKSALTAANVTSLYVAMTQNTAVGLTVFNGGSSFTAIFENPTNLTGYVTQFNIRGKRLRLYQPSVYTKRDEGSALAIGEHRLSFDMSYQDDPLVGKDLGDFLVTILPDALPQVNSVEIDGERNAYLQTMALAVEPGDRIHVTDAHSGLAEAYWVNGVTGAIDGSGGIGASLNIIRAYDVNFWQLGVAGFSELGETTFLVY